MQLWASKQIIFLPSLLDGHNDMYFLNVITRSGRDLNWDGVTHALVPSSILCNTCSLPPAPLDVAKVAHYPYPAPGPNTQVSSTYWRSVFLETPLNSLCIMGSALQPDFISYM